MNLKEQILELLRGDALAARDDLRAAAEKVATYAAEQAAELALLVDEPGFELAAEAARDNVLMRSGLRLVAQADATDARFVGILEGSLRIGAMALAAGLA